MNKSVPTRYVRGRGTRQQPATQVLPVQRTVRRTQVPENNHEFVAAIYQYGPHQTHIIFPFDLRYPPPPGNIIPVLQTVQPQQGQQTYCPSPADWTVTDIGFEAQFASPFGLTYWDAQRTKETMHIVQTIEDDDPTDPEDPTNVITNSTDIYLPIWEQIQADIEALQQHELRTPDDVERSLKALPTTTQERTVTSLQKTLLQPRQTR